MFSTCMFTGANNQKRNIVCEKVIFRGTLHQLYFLFIAIDDKMPLPYFRGKQTELMFVKVF